MSSPPPGYETPEYIWWCKTCNGGVACWGQDNNKPPPRCPDCHTFNFDPTKFVPVDDVEEVKGKLRLVWAYLTDGRVGASIDVCADYVAEAALEKMKGEEEEK